MWSYDLAHHPYREIRPLSFQFQSWEDCVAQVHFKTLDGSNTAPLRPMCICPSTKNHLLFLECQPLDVLLVSDWILWSRDYIETLCHRYKHLSSSLSSCYWCTRLTNQTPNRNTFHHVTDSIMSPLKYSSAFIKIWSAVCPKHFIFITFVWINVSKISYNIRIFHL